MTVSDAHDLAARGVIEGFYGRPFSHAQRLAMIRFIAGHGFDHYVYAPKNDPLHRESWREPYPAVDAAAFRELAQAGREGGVRFLYAIAPGLSFDAREPRDFTLLADKISTLVDAGVRGIALLFDDLTPDSTTLDPDVQAELVARTAQHVAAIDAALSFWFIGNFYCGDVSELRAGSGFWSALYGRNASDYFTAYARHVPPSIPVMWTGPAVFSARITADDAAAFRALAQRPVVLWDNFPVNDALPGQLFLGPYVGRDPEALRSLHGIVLNLMPQATANRIAIATAGEFFADPAAYDSEAALQRAVTALAVDAARAAPLRVFVEQQRGHPVLAAPDVASELARCIAAAFGDGASAQALADLREHLLVLERNHVALQQLLGDDPLLAEIAPWSEQLARLAAAALLGLAALHDDGQREAFVAARETARAHDHVVAATVLPPGLVPLVAGQGETVDRFAALFAEIERRLAVQT